MSCEDKDGGTHHFACDCREESFRKLQAELEEFKARCAILTLENQELKENL